MTATLTSPGHILLVDDEPAYQRLGASFLGNLGHRVTVAGDGEEAVSAYNGDRPQVVLLDLAMPPSMDPEAGLQLIGQFPSAVVVVLSGHGDRELALRAAELGAWDFLTKPIDPEMLKIVVTRAMHKAKLDAELRALRAREDDSEMGIVGQAAPIQQLRTAVRRVGPTSVNVMVLGPTGTGKELVARALHNCSGRREAAFAIIHCGALSPELLESELFGHLKGSFTGAHRDQPGLVETAHGGTLFLDEVGEMPQPMQVKPLRFLQEGSFMPVGGREIKRADVRIISATHRDLESMVHDGSFREDLFYRLKGVVLRTPSLSERRADVLLLATRFLRRASPRASFTVDAQSWLQDHEWPGNVRQLKAVVDSAGALLLAGTSTVDTHLLRFASGETVDLLEPGAADALGTVHLGSLDAAVLELESRMIRQALETAGGNQSEAARRLGISRMGLIKKMTRIGLR